MTEFMWYLIIAAICIFVIIRSSSKLIESISNYARTTGISEYLIGFVILSIGTALPELTTGIMSAIVKENVLSLGNVLGANILDATVVLGIAAVIGKKVKIEGKVYERTIITILLVTMLPLLLGLDGSLSREDGLVLITAFFLYLVTLVKKEGELGRIKDDVKWKHIYKDMIVFIISLAILLLGARWLVFSVVEISHQADIPLFLIGSLFITLGTTAPEITVSIHSALGRHSHLTFGNVFGAVIMNATLVLGVTVLIHPILFDRWLFIRTAVFMLVCVYIGSSFLRKEYITWKHGVVLMSLYVLFWIIETLL